MKAPTPPTWLHQDHHYKPPPKVLWGRRAVSSNFRQCWLLRTAKDNETTGCCFISST